MATTEHELKEALKHPALYFYMVMLETNKENIKKFDFLLNFANKGRVRWATK